MNFSIKKTIAIAVTAIAMVMLAIITVFAATEDHTLPTADVSMFKGKRVGVRTGTLYAVEYDKLVPGAEPYFFDTVADALTAMEQGKLDAVMLDSAQGIYVQSQKPNLELAIIAGTTEDLAVISSKSEEGIALINEFNGYLKEIKESGEFDRLQEKWMYSTEESRVMDTDPLPETNGVLHAVTSAEAPPFTYIKNGEIVGYEIELLRGFCKSKGLGLKLDNVAFAGALAGVASEKYDIGASSFSVSDERKKSLTFSDSDFVNHRSIMYPRTDAGSSSNSTLTVDDFAGKRIGVQSGTTYAASVEELIKDPQVMVFSNIPDEAEALLGGKIDAFLEENALIEYVASQSPGIKVLKIKDEPNQVAQAFDKSEEGLKLLDQYNKFLKKIKESGELEQLYDKWIRNSETAEVVDYTKLPDTNGTLVIGTEGTIAPFALVKNGVVTGLEPDIIGRFCEEYGYRPEFVTGNFDGLLAGLQSKKFDIVASSMNITEERKKSVNFSDPICETYTSLGYVEDNATPAEESFTESLNDSFDRTFVQEDRWKMFMDGIKITFLITVLSIVGGCIIGFLVHLICRTGGRIPNAISDFCRWLVEGLPVVVFLMILFYIVFGKSDIDGIWVAVIGFTIIFACFIQEMLRAGELAIDKGQYQAAEALGYGEIQSFFKIILPQALKYCIPSFTGEVTAHIKATAVVGYIAVVDLTKVGDLVRGRTYDAFFPLIAVAILYFVLAGILKLIVNLIVKKFDYTNRTEAEILKGINTHD